MMSQLDLAAWTLQIASCLFMTGVIAVIQLIHYPSFKVIATDQFSDFHQRHTKALGYIAAPGMCIELLTALWLIKNAELLIILNLVAVIVLWLVTFLVSVPAHNQLALRFNDSAWKRLLRTNWIRTALWSLRSGILIIYVIQSRELVQ